MSPRREADFFSISEILALASPSLPMSQQGLSDYARRAGWHDDATAYYIRPGRGRDGGQIAYHHRLLPPDVRNALVQARAQELVMQPAPVTDSAWADFDALPETAKQTARDRLMVIEAIDHLATTMTRQASVSIAAAQHGVATSTIWNWLALVADVPKSRRLPALAPRRTGNRTQAECDPRAWDFLVADYLRPEQPPFSTCFTRLEDAAKAHGWAPIPSSKTLQRRIESTFPRASRELARKGKDAVARIYPSQTRDRTIYTAMEAVNADGHKFDLFVKWADGTIGRAILVGVQDLFSGMPVGWRLDKSESWTLVRLAFADMAANWGLPREVYLDNGRAFASKYMTGGIANRFRFKVRDDEPAGVLTAWGCSIHWATPYHGQSKPIERMWREICDNVAKHPRCHGAYTGNNPLAKPENYGSRAIPIADLEELINTEIYRHIMRPGRRSMACAGRSIWETFKSSFDEHPPAQASAEMMRLALCAAEGVTARKPTGEVQLLGNRYWSPQLPDHMGRKLIVRFDPIDLHRGVAVYTLDGRWICDAPVIDATGFNDAEAARLHAADRRRWIKAQQELLGIERRMSVSDVVDLIPSMPALPRSPLAPAAALQISPTHNPNAGWTGETDFSRAMRLIEARGDE